MTAIERSLLAVLLAATATAVGAQPAFVDVTPADDPYFVTPPEEDFWVNAVAPADLDGDGDLDLAVLGTYVVYNVSAEDRLVILRNDGPGASGWSFLPTLVPLGTLTAGASDLAWGDFDGDGDHDLVVGSDGATVVFRNDAGVLAALAGELPGYWEDSAYTGAYDLRSLSWADADNDGDLDLLIPSVFDNTSLSFRTALARNDGPDGLGGWLFADAPTSLDPTVHAQSAWADADGDGDSDLLLVNVDPYTGSGFLRGYRNDGGVFVGQDLLGLRVEYGLADWGDYDGDGDLDLLVAGNIEEPGGTFATVLRVARNDGGSYAETDLVQAPGADWLDLHAATWADYDSDGDVDLLVTGNWVTGGEIVGKSEIFLAEGGVFTPQGLALTAPISSIGRGGAFSWFDLDGDGDLDYLVAGAFYVPGGNGLVESRMILSRNDAPGANQPPGAPVAPVVTADPCGAVLSWSPALDDHTPSAALTYDLALSRDGLPVPLGAHLPEAGALGATTTWRLCGLAPGHYDWSLRAVDAAFAGGPAAFGAFTVPVAVLFADGFASGTTGAWSLTQP